MKRINEPYKPKLSAKFISIDRDDLDNIIAILEKVGSVQILSGGYEFEDFDELKNKFGNKPPDLTILMTYKASSDHNFEKEFKLEFHKKANPYIFFPHKTTDWYSQILEILSNKENRALKFFTSFSVSMLLSITVGVSVTAIFLSRLWTFSFGVPLIISIGAVTSILLYGYYREIFMPWNIDLNFRHEPNFFKRNQEKIVWLVIGSFLTLLIKYFASLIPAFN